VWISLPGPARFPAGVHFVNRRFRAKGWPFAMLQRRAGVYEDCSLSLHHGAPLNLICDPVLKVDRLGDAENSCAARRFFSGLRSQRRSRQFTDNFPPTQWNAADQWCESTTAVMAVGLCVISLKKRVGFLKRTASVRCRSNGCAHSEASIEPFRAAIRLPPSSTSRLLRPDALFSSRNHGCGRWPLCARRD